MVAAFAEVVAAAVAGANYAILSDTHGNNLVMSSATYIRQVVEATARIRPEVAGDGTTSITVTVFLKE